MLSRITILIPLRNRAFRLLFAGQVISDLGDWLDYLALITLIIYHWNMGAGALAALSVVMALPAVIAAPVAGVWVDRLPRKAIMISSDLLRAAVVLGLIWAPELYSMLVLVFVRGIFTAFFTPARQATIRSTVPEEDLLAASSLSQLSLQVTKVIGPAIGGLLVAITGPRPAFFVNSLTFMGSAAILALLPRLSSSSAVSESGEPSFWGEFRAGLAYIVHRHTLVVAVTGMAAALFVIFTFDSLGALALKELGLGEALLGLAVSGIGLGTAIGAVLIGQWGMRFSPFAIMGAGKLVSGIMVMVIGAAVMLHISGAGIGWVPFWLVIGLAAAAMFIPYGYILQVETPQELLGRVSASANAVQTAFQLLAPPLGALLAGWFGVGFVFTTAGAVLALIGLVVLISRPKVGLNVDSVDSSVTASTV